MILGGIRVFPDAILEQRDRTRIVASLVHDPRQRIGNGRYLWHKGLSPLRHAQSNIKILALLSVDPSHVCVRYGEIGISFECPSIVFTSCFKIVLLEIQIAHEGAQRSGLRLQVERLLILRDSRISLMLLLVEPAHS